jgi:hypothetical protein
MVSDREEKAFREALQGLVPQNQPAPALRRRPRPAVMPKVLVAAAIVLLVSVIGLPRLLGGTAGDSAGSGGGAAVSAAAPEDAPVPPEVAPGSSAPRERDAKGWRTEYFRDISFQVPAGWGYAVPPQSDWCVDSPKGQPRPDQRTPYVWLGTDLVVRMIACPEPRPDSLLTEHVEAVVPGPATDYAEGEVRQGGWWIVTRFAGSAVLVVTTRDRELARQIVDSAATADDSAPCPAVSPVAGTVGSRPAAAADLAELTSVKWAAVCQYEAVLDQADVSLPRLRAASVQSGAPARDLVAKLRAAPENRSTCDPAPVDGRPEIALTVRIATGDGVREVYVAAAGCPTTQRGMAGGIDDGTRVRVLTRPACQALLLIQPIVLFSASGEVAANCLG